MLLDIRVHDVHPGGRAAAMRAHAERRVAFALGRFGDHVRELRLTLADDNGPRGGRDLVARVAVALHRGPVCHVVCRDGDPVALIDRALTRARRALLRRIDRRRRRDRTSAAGAPLAGAYGGA